MKRMNRTTCASVCACAILPLVITACERAEIIVLVSDGTAPVTAGETRLLAGGNVNRAGNLVAEVWLTGTGAPLPLSEVKMIFVSEQGDDKLQRLRGSGKVRVNVVCDGAGEWALFLTTELPPNTTQPTAGTLTAHYMVTFHALNPQARARNVGMYAGE